MNKYDFFLEKLYEINDKLRLENGLYVASSGPHYVNFVWIRDTYYQTKPNLKKSPKKYIKTYHSLLDYYKGLDKKYDNKIQWLIDEPHPVDNIRFIHPRFYPDLTEITSAWGNVQLDTFGYFFLGIAEGLKAGLDMFRDYSDIEIIQKLITILEKIRYWDVEDSGIWEENREIHASSIGAVVGGLKALKCNTNHVFNIPDELIRFGEERLNELLPMESITKDCDLSLLTLIYPFDILSNYNHSKIVDNIEKLLLRKNGVIRYKGDAYYNIANPANKYQERMYHAGLKDQYEGNEAEWVFGLAFLAMANSDCRLKMAHYIDKLIALINEDGLPELFYSKTDIRNDNTPLGWAVAMTILAIEKYETLYGETPCDNPAYNDDDLL